MSGHNKWSQIKRAKGINDSKRSKIFSKITKAITAASKQGGGDPDANPTLRLALEKARDARMPKDNIDRAIAKGAGGGADSAEFYDVIYEGYGPNGEAFYIKGLTDNKNRTVAEVRNVFAKFGGSLGGVGSTAYIFATDPDNPAFTVDVTDPDQIDKLTKMLDELEDHEDIQDIFINFNLPEQEDEE